MPDNVSHTVLYSDDCYSHIVACRYHSSVPWHNAIYDSWVITITIDDGVYATVDLYNHGTHNAWRYSAEWDDDESHDMDYWSDLIVGNVTGTNRSKITWTYRGSL